MTSQDSERLNKLIALQAIMKTGFAGVDAECKIVDRRHYPRAIPLPGCRTLGIPDPIHVEEIDCPNCYGGHQKPCQWCCDSGRVVNIPNSPTP